MPVSSGTTAADFTETVPLTVTAAAWTAEGSISSPTMVVARLAMFRTVGRRGSAVPQAHAPTPSVVRPCRRPLEGRCRWCVRSEAVQVAVDQTGAHEEGDEAPDGQERTERDLGPPAVGDALGGDDPGADDDAEDQGDEDGRSHGAAEEQAQDGDELDVAHAHALLVDQGGQVEEEAGGQAGDQLLGQVAGVQDGAQRDGEQRGGTGQRVGDALDVEVDDGDRHEERDEHEAQDHLRDVVDLQRDDEHVQRGGDRLDHRIARGDLLAAAAAAAAQDQPREDGDVVVGRQLRAATRALGAGLDERLAARQAPRDDVEERADEEAEQRGRGERGSHTSTVIGSSPRALDGAGYQLPPRQPLLPPEQVRVSESLAVRLMLKSPPDLEWPTTT